MTPEALVKIDVLDRGFVRLVEAMGSDLSIVRAARVSYNADWRVGTEEKSDERLINYLMKNNHTSPFESVVFTFEVKAPIFVFRQWHRHRTWSYNEISARYTELDEGFYIPDPAKLGTQHDSHKQMRDMARELPKMQQERVVWDMTAHCQAAFELYKDLIARGVPREISRSVLPLNAYSRMFATVDLHNLMHFLRLRLHAHAQYEIQEYAKAIVSLVEPVAPVAMRAFKETLKV